MAVQLKVGQSWPTLAMPISLAGETATGRLSWE
jgi:hypothetical protein